MRTTERSPDEWAYRLRDTYDGIRKPGWREFAPKQTWAHTQRVLFAKFYGWRDANPGPEGERSGAGMQRFLDTFGRWASTTTGDDRTTCFTLLDRFCDGAGQLDSGSPEASIRVALKTLPKRAQLHLLLKLASELV